MSGYGSERFKTEIECVNYASHIKNCITLSDNKALTFVL